MRCSAGCYRMQQDHIIYSVSAIVLLALEVYVLLDEQQRIRVPATCPPGFLGRYTVQAGDTFYQISQIFRVRFEALAVNNPHITNPSIIYPGDILCVPGQVVYPCCIMLRPLVRVPFGSGSVVYINFAPRGGQVVSFTSTLQQPRYFGNYDIYTGEIYIPDIGGFGNQLFPTPEDPPTWSARVELPTVASIAPNSQVAIRPSNSSTGVSGDFIFGAVVGRERCHP